MAFSDTTSASKILSTLSVGKNIIGATLITAEGERFVSYMKNEKESEFERNMLRNGGDVSSGTVLVDPMDLSGCRHRGGFYHHYW